MKWLDWLWKRRDKLREHRLKAIEVVNRIKKAVESEEADFVVKIIPGHTDDKALALIRIWLPRILRRWGLSDKDYYTHAMIDSVEGLKAMPKKERGQYYSTIAGEAYARLADLPLDTAMEEVEKEYKALTQAG